MNSDLLDGSKKFQIFVNGNETIFGCLFIALWSSYNINSDLLDVLKNFMNGKKIIFSYLYMALWSSYNMNSDFLDGSKKWENFCEWEKN